MSRLYCSFVPTHTAAATLSLPWSSIVASGLFLLFSISFSVMSHIH